MTTGPLDIYIHIVNTSVLYLGKCVKRARTPRHLEGILNIESSCFSTCCQNILSRVRAFFEDYPAGSDPQEAARASAVELAAILEAYNSGGIHPP
jgi:hypothetical protein